MNTIELQVTVKKKLQSLFLNIIKICLKSLKREKKILFLETVEVR